MKKLALLLTLSLFSSCASASLSEGGRGVRFVSVSPTGCKYLGEVTGHFKDAASFGMVTNTSDFARIALKNNAAKIGADTVEIASAGEREMSGEAYDCNRSPASK